MSEKLNPPQEEKSYQPASPVKRALAWIGLVYALLLLACTTYFFYTGTILTGLAPLLTLPGLIGLGLVALISRRTTGHPSPVIAWGVALICWILALGILPMALLILFEQWGG